MPAAYYPPGVHVQGAITGRYLGTVIRAFRDRVLIRGPDKAVFDMTPALIEPVKQERRNKR